MSTVVPTDERIGMKHGAGGRAMRRLIEESFRSAFTFEPELPAGLIGLSAMDDLFAHGVENGFAGREGIRLSAAHESESCPFRAADTAGDRRIKCR